MSPCYCPHFSSLYIFLRFDYLLNDLSPIHCTELYYCTSHQGHFGSADHWLIYLYSGQGSSAKQLMHLQSLPQNSGPKLHARVTLASTLSKFYNKTHFYSLNFNSVKELNLHIIFFFSFMVCLCCYKLCYF